MVMAVCLASGAAAVVSHRAAARLWGLVGFIDDRMIEVTVPRTCRRAYADVVHRPRCLPTSDVDTRDAIRVTTVARTLIDLASCVPVASLEEALDDALRRRLVTVRALRSRFADTAPSGRKGQAALRRLLEVREGRGRVPQSVFETRLLRALRRARLPAPEIQYEVRTARGRAVLDFAYPDKLLAIEADGFEWHSSRRQWDYDRARGTALALLGWRVIHVTWSELHEDPDAVVGAVRAMLVRK